MNTAESSLCAISSEIDIRQFPPFFQHGLSITDNAVSADMLLVAMLTATSSVLPRFYLEHGFPVHRYSANLMSLVIAPPASGKGIMNHANRLVEWADHIIPGNSSLSAFMSELERLQGRAYMMETEADVMSKNLRVNNNDYSYLLRQAWEGEPIRRARDGQNRQRVCIPHPQLSVLLSGTLNQLTPLLRSQSNGLTSRMLCYLVTEVQGFDSRVFGQDVLTEAATPTEIYAPLADYLQTLYEWQMQSDHDCRFCLTDEQSQQLTEWFQTCYDNLMLTMEMPIGFDSMLKRLAVTVMRIGLILNAVRLHATGDFPTELVCTDDDFRTMLTIADALVMHMLDVFVVLPEEEQLLPTDIVLSDRHAEAMMRRENLFNKLPDEFDTLAVHRLAEAEGLVFRTVERWITIWQKEAKIERLQQGHYRKCQI